MYQCVAVLVFMHSGNGVYVSSAFQQAVTFPCHLSIKSQLRRHFIWFGNDTFQKAHCLLESSCIAQGVTKVHPRTPEMQHLRCCSGLTASLWSVVRVQVSHIADKTRCETPPPSPSPPDYNRIAQLVWSATVPYFNNLTQKCQRRWSNIQNISLLSFPVILEPWKSLVVKLPLKFTQYFRRRME